MENIEVGKRYRTRSGRIVTVKSITGGIAKFDWLDLAGYLDYKTVWAENNNSWYVGRNGSHDCPQDFMEELGPEYESLQLSLFD